MKKKQQKQQQGASLYISNTRIYTTGFSTERSFFGYQWNAVCHMNERFFFANVQLVNRNTVHQAVC